MYPIHHQPVVRRRRSIWDRWWTYVAIIALFVGVGFGGGYAAVASAPGYAPWQDRVSTLLRQVGLGGPLDTFENWLYGRHAPPDTPPTADQLRGPFDGSASSAATSGYPYLPVLSSAVDGRGWQAVQRSPGSVPIVYAALLQPDRFHRSVVVGAALVRSSAVDAHLVAGTSEPSGTGSAGRIPPADLPNVVAAFNSGFKMSASPGGFFLNGRTVRPLVDGRASAVIDDGGRVTVGEWGRDVHMNAHISGVRQNLALIVDHGRPVPGLDRNADLRWGSARNQLQYTWRSGLGTTASGDLVYVAGDQLNLQTLGTAMAQAGAVTAMELDIHSGLQFFSAWVGNGSHSPAPERLLPAMSGPADRYVRADTRDFFYLTTAN